MTAVLERPTPQAAPRRILPKWMYLTRHARERMQERDINLDALLESVFNPEVVTYRRGDLVVVLAAKENGKNIPVLTCYHRESQKPAPVAEPVIDADTAELLLKVIAPEPVELPVVAHASIWARIWNWITRQKGTK